MTAMIEENNRCRHQRPARVGRLKSWKLSILLLASVCCGGPTRPPDSHVFNVNDYQYVRGKFFFLTDPDGVPMTADGIGTLVIGSVKVWIDDRDAGNDRTTTPAYVTLDGLVNTVHDSIEAGKASFGRFDRLLAGDEYTIDEGTYPGYPLLVLSDLRVLDGRMSKALAVSYETSRRSVGGLIPDSAGVFVLKLIRPAAGMGGTLPTDLTQGIFAATAKLELRNVYGLGPGLTAEKLVVRIRRKGTFDGVTDPDRIGDHTFLQILGLDLFTDSEGRRSFGPDGKIDRGRIDYDSGYVLFRELQPFAPTIGDIRLRMGPPDPARPDTLVEKVPEIYKRSTWTEEEASQVSKYGFEVVAWGR